MFGDYVLFVCMSMYHLYSDTSDKVTIALNRKFDVEL